MRFRIRILAELWTMRTEQPSCLLFDLGNVIVDLDIPATARSLEMLAGTRKEELNAFLLANRWLERYEVGEFSDETFLDGIKSCLPEGITSQQVRDAWNAMLLHIPLARLHWLAGLRNKYRVALLSNTNGIHLDWVHDHLLQEYGLTGYEAYCFDTTFYSHRIGQRKPETACYKLVLEKLRLNARDVLFIDDVPENTAAAASLGIRTATHPVGSEIMDRLEGYLTGRND